MKKIILGFMMILLAGSFFMSCKRKTPDTAKGTVEAIIKAAKENKPGDIYALFPDSYKKDIKSIILDYAGLIEKDTYKSFFSGLEIFVTSLDKHKEKALKKLPPVKTLKKEDIDNLIKFANSIVKIFKSAGLDEISGVKNIDVQKFLDNQGNELLEEFKTSTKNNKQAQFIGELEKIKIIESKEKDKKVIIKLEIDKKIENVTFVKVEDKWIPENIAKMWPLMVEKTKTDLKKMSKTFKSQQPMLKKMSAQFLKSAEKFKKDGDIKGLFGLFYMLSK
jgi:hypothetical protein